jgi:hypothetical protein
LMMKIETEFNISANLFVWDITGKNLLAKMPLGYMEPGLRSKEVNLSHLNDGFYLLEIQMQKGSLFKKLIIEK